MKLMLRSGGKGMLVFEMIREKNLWAGSCRHCKEYLKVLNGKEYFVMFRVCRLSKMGFAVDEYKMAPVFQTSNLPCDVWNSAFPISKLFTL